MRRLFSIAVIGLAVASATTIAEAQGRGGRPGRAGMDTSRMRRMDSVRVARGDTVRRRGPDSLRQHRMDSLRAAGVLDNAGRGPGGRGPGGQRGPGRGNLGLSGITLNDNEKSAVKTITEKYREELKELRDENQKAAMGQNAQLRTQMQAIMERERAEIRGALTAEHQAQFDANVARQRGRGAGGPPGRRPPPPARRDR